MRSRLLVLVIAAIAAAGGAAYYFRTPPAPPQGPAPIASGRLEPVQPITQIAPNLYVVPGGGCNTTVFVTSRGVVLVDTKYKDGVDGLLAQVRTVTDKPISYVINTHRHPDHAEGNTQLPAGVKVIVHRNNLQSFKEWRPVSGSGTGSWIGSDPVAMNDRLTLFDGDEAIDLYHFGPAHTDGDVFAVFRAARVMDVGDVMAAMRLPVIVLEAGGSGQTFAGVVDQALAIPNIDRIVTGHGPVLPHAELARYAKLNHALVDYVRTSLRPGSVKNDVFKAFTPSDEFKGYDFGRRVLTMDEIDRSIRPKWKRVWPFTR